ncbi:MAG: 16S rRNA (cytidine(1402)-2'-O)-methyltransferase [Candidatus Cloacimonadota bacterium]|nr:16S rRNA (cytidine(1402)-2'-O)-methyltransferase [Candidatus Cloacimonadota bacterium]
MKEGILYLVATPIGNLEDITFRAVRILREVDLIAAEDTRTSSVLLKQYEISTPLTSYHKFNEKQKAEFLIGQLKSGKSVAVVSDAGTPGISDPSEVILKECIKNSIPVIPIPGPSAVITALSASGLSTNSFSFWGFVPKTKSKQIEFLQDLISRKETMIFYESPKRVKQTLNAFLEVFGNRQIVVAKELTKIYETFFRGSIKEVLVQLDEKILKGEFVILLEGAGEKEISNSEIEKLLREKIVNGLSKSEAVKKVSKKFNIKKNRVYQVSLRI